MQLIRGSKTEDLRSTLREFSDLQKLAAHIDVFLVNEGREPEALILSLGELKQICSAMQPGGRENIARLLAGALHDYRSPVRTAPAELLAPGRLWLLISEWAPEVAQEELQSMRPDLQDRLLKQIVQIKAESSPPEYLFRDGSNAAHAQDMSSENFGSGLRRIFDTFGAPSSQF